MTLGLAYWVIMLLWLAFGLWHSGVIWLTGPNIILFLLLVLLGWQVFGVPLHK
jgi:hypothetical protein